MQGLRCDTIILLTINVLTTIMSTVNNYLMITQKLKYWHWCTILPTKVYVLTQKSTQWVLWHLSTLNVTSPPEENKVIGSNIQPLLNLQHCLSVQCTVFAPVHLQTQCCVRDQVSVVRLIMYTYNWHVVNITATTTLKITNIQWLSVISLMLGSVAHHK